MCRCSPAYGPFRYEFLVGPLKGHTYPIDPWVHVEKVSFRPTQNVEFGFERTVIWGGKGHEPITVKSFLRSFFSLLRPMMLTCQRQFLEIPAPALALSIFLTGFPSSATGSCCTATRKCMTMSRRSMRPAAHPGGRVSIYPMCRAFRSWTFASKPPPPIRRYRLATAVTSCTTRQSSARDIPTTASFSATGLAVKTKAAKAGSLTI